MTTTGAGRAREGGFLRNLILDNLLLKVLSIVASLALFSLVRGAEDAQRSVFVDVVAVLPDASGDRILLSDIPDRVRVTLRGSRALLNSIRRDDIPPILVTLDDSQARLYYLDPERIEVPAGVEIIQIAPATIPLQWADRAQRTLPVQPTIDGRPAPGLMLAGAPQVRPQAVTVTGPAPEISPLDHITTDPITITGMEAGRHERRVPLMRLPPHAEYEGDAMANVVFEIAPQIAERSLPRLDVAVVGGMVRELRPARVRVRVRGAPATLDAMDPLQVVPYVDVSQLETTAGAQTVPVRVRGIPDGVELVDVEPADLLASPSRVDPR
ncbi:MAG: CdaR family protein [Myxococcota bacterium]|nr:CdaR family protein [Myxococcota bacterium]